MSSFIERILGVEPGFLSRSGELSLQFRPKWPLQDALGAFTWNFTLGLLALGLVIWVYSRDGRSPRARISLAILRALLLGMVLFWLNRPEINRGQSRTEPSVLAVVMDESISMRVRDVGGQSRFDAMLKLMTRDNEALVRALNDRHELRFYRFSKDALPVAELSSTAGLKTEPGATAAAGTRPASITTVLEGIKTEGQATRVLGSLKTVLESLQGQRLAGVVVLTDGRSVPIESDAMAPVQAMRTPIYTIALGSKAAPKNLAVESISVQESAFVKDIVNVRAMVRGSGYPANHTAIVRLREKNRDVPLVTPAGRPAEAVVTLVGDAPQETEITFKPAEVGTLDFIVEVINQPGELDDQDNRLPAQIAVLDARISVLYVDGYPRWEYRYIKNSLMRDVTVDVSCLLLSADKGFAQEGDKPITRFPENMSELLPYDVVLFGDVDPNEFADHQLRLVQEFVADKGGGFGMIAGPKWAPTKFIGTDIEKILPVLIRGTPEKPDDTQPIKVGWRPVLTKEGEASTVFRFFEDRQANKDFLEKQIQPLFWYQRGIMVKPGVGEVYAEHPSDEGTDKRKTPLLVLGRFGAGRTLFSGIDDSWRWRFYTGEHIFDTYWVQQVRHLARSKKLGQRRFTLNSSRPAYELGEQVQVNLRVLDPELLKQLPDQISVTIVDGKGMAVRQETMQRREGQDLFIASWTADSVGQFTVKLPALGGVEGPEQPITVKIPRLELLQPAADVELLRDLATKTGGKLIAYENAAAELAEIPSAAQIIPIDSTLRFWEWPRMMVVFMVTCVLLITAEWVLRKVYGML